MNPWAWGSTLFRRTKKSVYARNIGWLVRGNLLAQLIQVFALPVISRLYSPDDFGVFSLFIAFVGFSIVALTLRLESALLIADNNDIYSLAAGSLLFVLLLGTIFSVLLMLFQQHALLGFEILPSWAPFVVLLTLTGHGFFNTGRALLLRSGDARNIAKARVEKSFSNVLSKIGMGFPEWGSIGLILGEAVGSWFAFRRVSKGLLGLFHSSCDRFKGEVAGIWKRYRKFPLLELPSTLADQAALTLPVPMMASIGGAEAAGAYGMARMIVALPNAQIGMAFADGFQWKIGEMVRQKKYNNLMLTMFRTGVSLAVLGFIPFTLLGLFSPWAFPLILGKEWALSGSFAALLAIWMYLALIVSPLSRILSVLKQQEFKLLYDFFVLITLLALYAYALSTEMEPLQFLGYMVVINSVGYLLYACILVFVCRRFVSKSIVL